MATQPETSEPQFTPGPWSIGKERGKYRVRVNGDGWSQFAKVVVRVRGDDLDNPTGIANAHLIATAPELYTALKAICDEAETMTMTMRRRVIFNDGLAALFKARGGAA